METSHSPKEQPRLSIVDYLKSGRCKVIHREETARPNLYTMTHPKETVEPGIRTETYLGKMVKTTNAFRTVKPTYPKKERKMDEAYPKRIVLMKLHPVKIINLKVVTNLALRSMLTRDGSGTSTK